MLRSNWSTTRAGHRPLDELAGQRSPAFCGIGNPEGFRRTLLPLCGELLDLRVFPDHHDYAAEDVQALERVGAASLDAKSRLDHAEGFGEASRAPRWVRPRCEPSGSGSRSWPGKTSWKTSWPGCCMPGYPTERAEKELS